MSVGQIISRLSLVKKDLQELPAFANTAGTSVKEAAALVTSVLDAVSDKSLASDIDQHVSVITSAYESAQSAQKPIDETITRFRNVRG